MLGGSVSDLRSTMCELQGRLQTVDGEGKLTVYLYRLIYWLTVAVFAYQYVEKDNGNFTSRLLVFII